MDFENYYELLGISRQAAPAEIKKAYHEKIKAWHPDKNSGRHAPAQQQAEQMSKVLNQAYYILSDKKRRKNYDELLQYTEHQAFEKKIHEQAFWRKLEKAAPVLKNVLESVKDLFYLFKDAIRGKYKVHPVTLGLVGSGLLYLLIPLDVLPDFLPFLGFIDDLTVLTTIMATVQTELTEYRTWRLKKDE